MARRVVVTGIGLVTPVGIGREATWKSLLAGVCGVDHIASFNSEGFDTRIAAEVKGFNPDAMLNPKAARRMDRFAQLACAASLEAVQHAGIQMDRENRDRVAVMVGSGVGGIQTLSEQFKVLETKGPTRVNPFLVPMMLGDMASGQVSMLIGAKGPNFATVSACASGGDAIGEAFEMIRRGRIDVAFAGGSEAAICPIAIAGFNSCQALSKRNDDPKKASRPFDFERDGFVLGEGAGLIVLESLEHAEKRGAKVLAEMAGYGATSDAHHVTQPDPEGEGAARAMRHALDEAGMRPEQIDYINAHGTSTPLNDKLETLSMRRVFGPQAHRVPVSSTKSMTGHLLGAAGGIEAAFSVMAIAESAIPPTINLEFPDPDCDMDYTPHTARRGRVASAMSNSLGFGGHNCSLIFREFIN
ncbi:MAG: beta-ketoacyl-[acyl-carrier-protein] synthase II [Dehalococcoidia bacterium]|nr:beta-ketoacyl-[acyl-carrier-protein] synthase II [Dehalococcoidia bacterium]MSQ35225.1 beta-ketoacyl-[acyl-carrier-protein] synthase II [Dehalococcoidia bacterium]